MARFEKGRSGNPAGRPKRRRPNVSAFDIIFDKKIAVTQNGVERELDVDEVLELKTYQDALKGKRMAVREVLKMIERRERALAALAPPPNPVPCEVIFQNDPRNADEAMVLLGIAEPSDREVAAQYGQPLKLAHWAAQSAISRPGRKLLDKKQVDDVERNTIDPEKLKWPGGEKR